MSSSTTSTPALIGISVAIALAVSLTLSITINFVYITQIIENVVVDIIDEKIDEFNQTLTQPQPQPTPTPEPQPEPTPTCEPDEIYNTTSKQCEEIPPEVCTPEQIYNPDTNRCDPKPVPVPTPTPVPTCPEDQKYNTTTQKCEPVIIPNPEPTPVPEPTPTPTPTGNITVAVTGDVEDSSAGNLVFNKIKSANTNDVIVLGDLGYEENLAWFKQSYGSLGNKMWCVVGNHDAPEDGSSSIYTEAKQFCGNSYWIKRGVNLFVIINTNDPDLNTLATKTGQIFTNATIMQGVKNVHFFSHKPYATNPNSHHPVESGVKAFYDSVKTKIPSTIKVYYTAAHNHVMASTADGTFKTIGAGGRSHYECGTSTTWTFCNNSNYGFLQLTLTSDGKVFYKFLDYNGRILKQG